MAKTVKLGDLADAIAQELTLYHEDIVEGVNAAGDKAMKELVKQTKQRAPVHTGAFKKNIASKTVDAGNGMKSFIWYVKAPLHRIVHLLVHGHEKTNGGRVPGDPFLQKSLDTVLPDYEKDVEEVLKNGK